MAILLARRRAARALRNEVRGAQRRAGHSTWHTGVVRGRTAPALLAALYSIIVTLGGRVARRMPQSCNTAHHVVHRALRSVVLGTCPFARAYAICLKKTLTCVLYEFLTLPGANNLDVLPNVEMFGFLDVLCLDFLQVTNTGSLL